MKKLVFKGLLVSMAGAAVLATGLPAVGAAQKVLAVGSTALQPLAAEAGEMYSDSHSGASITVQGGGSGAGLSQVGKGGVTIGNSDIFAEQKSGIDASKLKDHKVAVVGITPVVNKDIKVENLKKQQLQDIFAGKITNWKEVGGNDEKIVLINRAQGSGTRTTFEQAVMGGTEVKTAQEQDDNGAVQKIVGQTPGAISYLAFSYTNGKSAKNLKKISIDHVKPTNKNVTTNKWSIWAYEHMYTTLSPDKTTKSFIKFMTSKAVEKAVTKKLGYIPVKSMKVTKDADGTVVK
ncbi:phosphate ABC transporter substrate-binding protein [Weissella diestrammenae]|uniref:Phosphate-binding protein n=1 Tax=Weissella diestrammenae TaxID=1162633 RepID=A0A7G9T3X6_9LACO|nr:phosphate ABC transporter substrate-binding protein [Weissella diestrammenae]MCM0582997.1 phosphate ABC transporter substrate-binding protein [Weissella diestrammenae]QNN74801.1 phosphate ABC transporter substrate-binding protein [Weissella diestrammenae]